MLNHCFLWRRCLAKKLFSKPIGYLEILLKKKWLFGILDDFVTKQLAHNVTWGLSLLCEMEHKGNLYITSAQGLDGLPVPSSTATNIQAKARVSDLIDHVNKCWKTDLINDLFDSNTASLILNMRIPRCSKDKLVWTLTKNGFFTVKSAYYALYNQKFHQGVSMAQASQNSFWKKIWSINAIPRIKLFVWKCVRDILPSHERLNRNYSQQDIKCNRCRSEDESSLHMLLYCPFARSIWFTTVGYRCNEGQFNSLKIGFSAGLKQEIVWSARWLL
ncbi:uncharacterized protein LOC113302224 [Papaver somniferum]|uniref:uncharacterized protein LOC113302224 n=1 Tax=Papaver somniferum TaxID=3469 RepID=UPI000E703248|nr:uncharacterized protein LOC113302224 [Papaver somniferum]XP_026406881.1 uncharacterized protein LOC113302224 [Papaver somniferum]